ncbi:hypothetical protein [Sporosarcina sp. FA9]|uniref:hypothetical protein n=1 Tax=Sporosarcina sp. FA9 TaxID=3413030 RepID=UPI003F65D5CC
MEYTDVLLIAIIFALVEFLKYLEVPKKILPIASLILGVVGGIFYIFPHDLKAGILTGLIMGLAASGFYSGGKTVIEKGDK